MTPRDHSSDAPRSAHLLAIAGAVAFAIALRIPAIDAPLGNDEAGSAVVGAAWLSGVDGAAGSYGPYWLDRPPLLPLAYGAADLLGGVTGIRVLGMLAAVATVLLCALIAARIGGRRAGACAAWVAAALVSAATLSGDQTYGELVAGSVAAASIYALLAGTTRRWPWLPLAGVLAAAAMLVKQSALDALLVGAVVLLAHGRGREGLDWRGGVAWSGGVALVVAATLGWVIQAPGGVAAAWDALFGFRLEVMLGGGQSVLDPAGESSVLQLGPPLLASGLLLALVATTWVALKAPIHGPHRAVVVAWPLAAVVGVLGGGYYWPHYLLQLAAPAAVGTGIWLASRSSRGRSIGIATAAAFCVAGLALADAMPHAGANDATAQRVGQAVAERAAPGDRIEVLYARPGVVHASGLRSTSPYLWRSMYAMRDQARAGVSERLSSSSPPEWVVRWNPPRCFELDGDGSISQIVDQRYELVTTVDGREVLRLRERRPTMALAQVSRPQRVDRRLDAARSCR